MLIQRELALLHHVVNTFIFLIWPIILSIDLSLTSKFTTPYFL